MPKRKAETEAEVEVEKDQPDDQPADDGDEPGDDDGDDDSDGSNDKGSEGEDDDEEDDDDEGDDDEDSFPEASSSGAESEDDEEGEAYKEVNVQFEFFDPQERDFHGLKALLNTYLDGEQYDSSGLVDAIINQTAVGTVVKSSEEDDPFAVMTAFNTAMGRHTADPWVGHVRDYMLRRCPDKDTKAKLEKAFAGPGTALLVSERLINCPPQLAPPLMQMLTEEVEGAAHDEDYPQAERDEFSFHRYLHFTRVYTDPQEDEEGGEVAAGGSAGAGPSSAAEAGGGGKRGKGKKAPLIVYVRPEDEYLHQVAAWSFTFPVEGRPMAKDDLRPLRAVMCVEAGRVGEARAMMDLVVGNMMEGEEGGQGGKAAAAAAAGGAGGSGSKGGGRGDGKGRQQAKAGRKP